MVSAMFYGIMSMREQLSTPIIYPDAAFIFPRWMKPADIRSWCRGRGWLPKDEQGVIETSPGQKAEIWAGRLSSGHEHVNLKFTCMS